MVSKEEVERVAKLMKIDLDDHLVHVDRVQKMIEYFNILDDAGVESEELIVQEKSISALREDKYIPYDEKLIKKIKKFPRQLHPCTKDGLIEIISFCIRIY